MIKQRIEMAEDDGGIQYWQQLGLQQQFESIFNDEVKHGSPKEINGSKDRATEHTTEEIRTQ